jgi:hypothetical protein
VESFTGHSRQLETGSEPAATPIFDVRSEPLAKLTKDASASHNVGRILGSMNGTSRVGVAKFNSAI